MLCFPKTIELKQYDFVFYHNMVHRLTYSKRNGECSSFRCIQRGKFVANSPMNVGQKPNLATYGYAI